MDAATSSARLAAHGMRLVVGLHVVYELAAAFLRPDNVTIGKELFRFVRDLDPAFTPPTMGLLRQEIIELRTNAAVLPFLPHRDQTATRLEVHRLADGIFDAAQETSSRQGESPLVTAR